MSARPQRHAAPPRRRPPRVAELMDPPPPRLPATRSVDAALRRLRAESDPEVLVMRGSHVMGSLPGGLLRRASRLGLGHLTLGELVAAPSVRVSPQTDLVEARRRAETSGRPYLVVVAGGQVVGAVDRRRLARRASGRGEVEGRWPWRAVAGWRGRRLAGALERCAPGGALAALLELGRIAERRGERACLVGGSVRDLLLGREVPDLDVVVEGVAGEVAAELAARLRGECSGFPRFGTAMVRIPRGVRIDIAAARRESYGEPAALPRTAPGSLREDAERRDFTLNTLLIGLDGAGFSGLMDPLGGLEDLRRGRLRLLHGLSLIEDPTRALRALRLAARFGFRLTAESARLLAVARRERVFERLTPERLRRELEPLFAVATPAAAVRLLARHGLLGVMHPRLRHDPATRRRLQRASRALAAHPQEGRGWSLALLVLAARLTATERGQLVERLRPERAVSRLVREGPEAIRRLLRALVDCPRLSPGRVDALAHGRSTELLLAAAATTSSRRVRRALLVYLSRIGGLELRIDGADLLEAGIPPGPAIAAGLAAARRAALDGRADDRRGQLRAALRAARPA